MTECVTSDQRNFEDMPFEGLHSSVNPHSSAEGFEVRGLEHTHHELTRTLECSGNNQLFLESCCATSDANAEPLVDSDSGHGKTDLLVEHMDPWSDEYENIPGRATDVDVNGVDLVNPFVSGPRWRQLFLRTIPAAPIVSERQLRIPFPR